MGDSTAYEFEKELSKFGSEKAYICPHTQDEHCSCRKPSSELLIRASNEYEVNLTRCVVIVGVAYQRGLTMLWLKMGIG